jgi:predicted chitinase
MAKQQKFTLNDFQFDKNLDVPDFDFDLKPPKDNRKPVTKVAAGLKEGISLSAKNSEFIKGVIEKALPRGYGSAYDLAEKSFGSIKSLYDDTTKEIRPFMNDLKRTTARLLPKVEQAMPDKLKKQVKDWTETADAKPGSSNYDPREAEISAMLAGFAQVQSELQYKQTTESDTKDRLREGLEQVRHRDKLKQMDSLRVGIAQLVDYQSNVTANYHRKSLELQYRHYFVAVDALEETKRSNAEMRLLLQSVVHNTALPEQAKLKASDTFKDMAKQQAMKLIGGTILGRGQEFLNNLTGNLKKNALRTVKGGLGHGRSGMDMLNGVLDADDMARAMGMQTDPYHAGGMVAGAFGTGIIGQWLAKKMAPHLQKMPGVKKFGNKLQYGVENVPQMLGEWARSNKHENGGITDGLVRFLKMNVRSSQKMQTGLQKDTVEGMGEPSYFSRQSAKSLNEIIPGYLARILRELQVTRTGDPNVEMTHYDYTKNKFDTQSNVRTNAFKSLVKDNERKWTTESIDSLIDEVTTKTGKTLTPEQKKILGSQLLRNNVKGRLGGEEVLGNRRRYDGDAAPHADAFADLFKTYFRNDHDNERKHSFANAYNAFGQYASASREKVQHFSNLGMNDFLNEAGLLNDDEDGVKLEQFFDYYYGKDFNPAAGSTANGFRPAQAGAAAAAVGPRRRRRRGNAGSIGRANRGGVHQALSQLAAGPVPSFATPGLITPSFVPTTANAGAYSPQPNAAVGTPKYRQQLANYLQKLGVPVQQVNALVEQTVSAMGATAHGAVQGAAGLQAAGTQRAGGFFSNARDHAREFANRTASGARALHENAKNHIETLLEKLSEGVGSISDGIKAIQERFAEALPVMVVGNAADGSIPAGAAGTGRKVRWWNKSIKDGVKSLASGAWGGMKSAGKLGNWLVGSSFGGLFGTAKAVGGMATGLAGKVIDKARGFKDVYSEETGPRKVLLYAARLKAGEYFDVKTGKPVKTWRDIQGAVADASGIVMTEEQASTAYVREGLAKKALRGLGAGVKVASKLGSFLGGNLLGGPLAGYKAIAKLGELAIKGALGYANGPQDVYVFDKDHPKRLRKALDAKTMRAGGYHSAVNDKAIKSPKDIDGEVYNYKGVTVLDEEEFKRGLYDKNGNPLKHGVARLLSGATKILGGGFGALKWLAGGVNQGIGHAFGLGKGMFSGLGSLFGKTGIFFGGGKKLMSAVEEIRDLLKDRLPERHRIRKGSIEDQHKSRKEQLEEEWKKHLGQNGQGDDSQKKGGILSLLSGLFKRKKKKDDDEDDSKGGLVDGVESAVEQTIADKILGKIPGGKLLRKIPGLGRLFGKGGAGAAAGAAENIVGGAAKQGLGSRIMGGLKWGKGLGAGMALTGASALANATGHDTIGKGLGYAGDAATGWSLASGAAGLLGVEGGALGLAGAAGGTLLTGLGAVLASPVLLPALGIAAAGAAVYSGYRLLTRNKLDALSKIRYAQYGWKPEDDGNVHKVFALENALMPGVTYVGGQAQIDPKKVDIKSAVEGLGVDLKDKDQVQNFATWYVRRFKPVFITHLTILNNIKKGTALSDANDKLSSAEKKTFLQGIRMPADPYNSMVSPIPGEKQLSAGADDVKAVMDEVQAANDKEVEKDKDKKTNDKADKAKDEAKHDAATKGDNKPEPSWMDNLKSGISNAWDKTKQFAGNAWDATKNVASSVGSAASSLISGAGDALKSGYQAAKGAAGKIGATLTASASAIKGALIAAMKTAGMSDPTEQAMFMAQMDHESGGFKSLSENLNYRPSVLASLFKSHFNGEGDAANVAAAGPQAIANRIYGGRMGNTGPDDGWNYRGRGVVQLTGKANYAKYGKMTGLDLVNNPDLASDPANAAKIALAYWKDRVSSAAAKAGDVLSVTKAINGGTNGLSDRQAKFQAYLGQAQQGQLGGKPDPNAKAGEAGTQVASTGGAPATGSAGGAGAAGATGAAAGGIIKVADQTPGPAPALKSTPATAPDAAPVDNGASAAVSALPDSINSQTAAAMGGFQNRSKDLAAQSQAQSQDLAKTLGPVSDVLKQSLDVQKQMLTALQQLVGFAGKQGSNSQANAKTPTGTLSPDAMQRKTPQPMTSAPVSMSKVA